MGRTNIEIDDDLIKVVMERYGINTKREAVDFALRSLIGGRFRIRDLLDLEGIGWEGDLDEMRATRTFE